jgi:hypothetical protein
LANKGIAVGKYEENRKLLLQIVESLIIVAKNDYKGITATIQHDQLPDRSSRQGGSSSLKKDLQNMRSIEIDKKNNIPLREINNT